MKCLVVAALVVAAVGSPLPDESCEVVGYPGAVPIGSHYVTHYAQTPAVQHVVSAPVQHYHATYATAGRPGVVTYAAAPAPQPVQPTQEVQRATAAFMAAWNTAAARASTIQAALVKTAPSGRYVYQVPQQVQETEEVKRATAQFMEAWNAAARRATVVEQAIGSLPQPVQQTAEVQQATAQFLAAWEAAAQQASTIRQAVTVSATPYSGAPRPVQATEEVKRATAEFMEAWRKAAARVPSIQTTLYTISGTAPAYETPKIVGGVPQFTPSVAQATAEFLKVWNAAAAAAEAAPDVNIIMGASSQPRPARPAAPQAPAAVTYAAAPAPSHALPQPVQPTPEVQQATAAFMAAWNKAAARASTIQAALVKTAPSGRYVYQVPQQVQETEEVKRATAQFMEAWNAAARRATVVEQAIGSLPQPVQQTAEVQRATAQFLAAWEAAAQQASTIRQAVTVSATPYSGAPRPVQATEEVKRATAEFMEAWRKAAARVPSIQTTLYTISGTAPAYETPKIVGGVPQFTPSVAQATAEFLKVWNAAAAAAEAAPDVNIIMGASSLPRPARPAAPQAPAAVTYAAAPAPSHTLPQPVQPTPEVQRATAAFMAAWNTAAARASTIQAALVKTAPSGRYVYQVPQQVQETEEVKRATAQFMEAWNAAARRATVVEQAIGSLPQPVQQTAEVQQATAQFLAAWEAAAQQASTIRQAVTVSATPYSGAPRPVQATEEVKRATAEFMEAWRKAAARVPSIQTTLYTISGTAPAYETPKIVGGVPQFTPSVAQATAEFLKVWNAAAAAAEAAPDVNIIMGASSLPRPARPAAPQAPAAVTYAAAPAPSHTLPQPVQPTPEVQRATAAFMAAWNTAAARASTIQAALVKTAPSGRYVYQVPQQVQETEEVKRATAQFMEAWNAAARRATVVEQAIGSLPQPVQQTAEVQQATAQFLAAWEAAAQQASTIRQAVTVSATPYSGAPRPVQATEEVKRATAEFMEAWRKAAARVPSIQTTLYTISGTAPAYETPKIVGGVPQFTPSVAQATAEFLKVWNAAAAAAEAAPDVNIIMGASSLPRPARPAAPQAPAAVTYAAAPAPSHALPQPVQPTPEVQRATAAFMAAWNTAAARASTIQAALVKTAPSGRYVYQVPQQVQETEEVKRATAQFMEAWNAAARRATVVEQAIGSLPQPVQQTAEVQRATAQFLAAWEAAAQQASTIRQAVTVSATPYSGAPRPVQATEEVKRATAEFMEAWRKAAARVPSIQTTLYTISGTAPAYETPKIVGGVPQFTPSVAQATAEFLKVWNAAAAAAEAAPDVNIIMGASSLPYPARPAAPHVPAAVTYAAAPAVSYGVPQPVQPTLEVQRATAAFMAAWNAAAERATKIQATLVKSATIAAPRQVEETAAVKKATAEFMAAWNAAARRATVVEQAISTLPKQVDYTDDVKMATAEFMSSWHAAAQRASTIYSAVSTTPYGVPQQVQPTREVQKATAEFMAAWNEAAARVPKIETTLYTLSGSSALDPARAPQPVSDTPEVKAAKKAFMAKFRAAQQAAGLTSVSHGVLPAPTVLSVSPTHHLAYSTGALHQTYTISDRIFAPFSGFPIYVKDC